MIRNDFAVFILSHGRPDTCITYKSLMSAGYTGSVYILIDNEDKTADKYYKNFGKDKVIMFDKKEQAKHTQTYDNFDGRKAIVYARNANYKIAKELGYKYILQLDDDYTEFSYRFNDSLEFAHISIKSIDKIFNAYIEFLINTKCKSIAFAQGGDLIGGSEGQYVKDGVKLKRKCMNTWFLDVENQVEFKGKMNEDYTASILYGSQGELFFTSYLNAISQIQTQAGTGGMTDTYLDNGTYVKTFYSVIAMPSCVKVSMMGESNRRLHHLTKWNNAVPKILAEGNKKYNVYYNGKRQNI